MAKSYYAILGVTHRATSDEIRSAYRRLAKEFHPDHYGGDSTTFRMIQEAYAILGDAHRRSQYEHSLAKTAKRRPSSGSPIPGVEPLIPEQRPVGRGALSPTRSFQRITPSFDEVFDWLWNTFASVDHRPSGGVRSFTIEVPLSRDQARRGGNARVWVPARAECPLCRSSGVLGLYECPQCAGEGVIAGEVPVSVAFPPGLNADHQVVIPLERFGIRHLRVTVLFRPIPAEHF